MSENDALDTFRMCEDLNFTDFNEPLSERRRLAALDFAVRTCGPDSIGDRVLTVARRYEAFLRGEDVPPPTLAERVAAA